MMTSDTMPPRMLRIRRADQPDVVSEIRIYPSQDHPATVRELGDLRLALATEHLRHAETIGRLDEVLADNRALAGRLGPLYARVDALERTRRRSWLAPLGVALAALMVARERLALAVRGVARC